MCLDPGRARVGRGKSSLGGCLASSLRSQTAACTPVRAGSSRTCLRVDNPWHNPWCAAGPRGTSTNAPARACGFHAPLGTSWAISAGRMTCLYS